MGAAPERIELLGFQVTYLHSDPNAGVSLLEWEAPPGAGGIPVHVHQHTEEGFYVLRGQIAVWLEGEARVAGPGSYMVARPGQPHTFWNPGDAPAAYLTPIAPGGFEGYLRDLAGELRRNESEEEAAAVRERLGQRYDITVVGPPPPSTTA